MCGITGFIDFSQKSKLELLQNMVHSLHHRGPDNEGTEMFWEESGIVGLGHARLSIIDITSAGNQPMHYAENSIVFNGEIYNYNEIRKELISLNHTFNTHSDTEVILHAYKAWGKSCVEKFIGMFAVALFDKKKKEIIFFRDRAGVKPLFYYWDGITFLFGSELKALHKHPGFNKVMDSTGISLFFKYGHIPSPHSIFKNTQKLEAGHLLTINLTTREVKIEKYWDVLDYYRRPQMNISYKEAKQEVEKLLISSCNYRMVADVPVGVFLSGGYDSTIVAACLQKDRTEKIKTFTIGFQEGNNEACFAKETAAYLGTDHTEYYCTTKQAIDIIPTLPYYFDEPFSDSSSIPTILVSRLAVQDVKVALSADGGDELFTGYNSYQSLNRNLNLLNKIPNELEAPAKSILGILTQLPFGNDSFSKLKMYGLLRGLSVDMKYRVSQIFDSMQSYPYDNSKKLIKKFENNIYSNQIDSDDFHDFISVGMAMDYRNYLQNDILTKVDRATMSVSLEGREPLLDHRLLEFVARLPIEYKYDGITRKKILKEIVHKYVPQNKMDRPKTGFGLPIYEWLRGDLSYLLNDFLSESNIKHVEIFNIENVEKLKHAFSEGKLYFQEIIWRILQFQMWYKQWM